MRRAWIAWMAICIIWGTTYLAIKVALETVPPFLMGGLRYGIAGIVMAVWMIASGRALPARREWPKLALLGFFMLTLGNGGVVWGEQFLTSGLTAVVVATSPFWMVGVDAALAGGDALRVRQVIGLIVGFSGIVLLVWPALSPGGIGAWQFGIGLVSLQVACLGWAIASAYTRRHVTRGDLIGAAAIQMLSGGLFLLLMGSLRGEWAHISFTLRTGTALTYLTVAGSIIAFVAYSYALGHLPVAIVSTYTYVNPVIAVALGVLILGEPFAPRELVAAAVILLGMMIVRSPSGGPLETERP